MEESAKEPVAGIAPLPVVMSIDIPKEDREEQLRLMRENNLLIRRQIKDNNNWTLILLRGMVMGLGAAVGATVILSLAVYVLRPMGNLPAVGPAVDKLVQTLEKLEKHRPGGGVIGEDEAAARAIEGKAELRSGSTGVGEPSQQNPNQ